MWFLFAGLSLQRLVVQSKPEPAQPPPLNVFAARQPWCGVTGPIDSLAAELQARRALGEAFFVNYGLTVYSLFEQQEGFLISMGPRIDKDNIILGGGGLVWIDRGNGCVTVLGRYQ